MEADKDRIMIDIETVGTRVGCNILSIGAVRFSLAGVSELKKDQFYRRICHESIQHRFNYELDTMLWWESQKAEIKAEAFGGTDDPYAAIVSFINFITNTGAKKKELFSKHSNFDFPILEHYIESLGYQVPWHYWEINCYATLAQQMQFINIPRDNLGHKHHALADAINQAAHCAILLKFLTWGEQPSAMANSNPIFMGRTK